MIKTVLDAPVGTKIELAVSGFGVHGKEYFEITERSGRKMLTALDENGNRTNRQSLVLNRENVKKHFGGTQFRKGGEFIGTGTVKLTYPENVSEENFEIEGDPDTTITDDMIVAEKDLTSQQKTFTEIGNKLGLPVKFFKGDKDFKGVLRKGTSYINVNNKNFEQTFYHEAAHYLSFFNPELFDQIIDVANITEKQRQAVRDKSPHYKNLTKRQLNEEILADNFMDLSKRAGFLREVGKQNKTLAEKFISWLKSLMDKFTSFFSNPKGGLTRTQRNAMYNSFKKNIDSIVDGNGNRIFRMNRETHEIQRFNGEKLPVMDLQMFDENPVDRQGNLTDNVAQKVFDKYLNGGIMKMVDDTISKEISKYVDLSKMSDPVARDRARDKLPYINRLLTQYNTKIIQNNENYKNHYATKIEYARRCFDNDERIRNESVRQVVGNEKQSGVRGNRNEIRPNVNTQGTGRLVRQGDVGVSRNVSNEVSGSRKHFLKLYEEEKLSERQRAFLNADDQYSIDPSDNSNESLFKKIKNSLSGLWSGDRRNPRIRREMTKRIEKALGDWKIRYEHYIDDKPVIVDAFNKVMHVQKDYDFPNVLQEAGKIIAKDLNLPQTPAMSNYIADWIMDNAPTNSNGC